MKYIYYDEDGTVAMVADGPIFASKFRVATVPDEEINKKKLEEGYRVKYLDDKIEYESTAAIEQKQTVEDLRKQVIEAKDVDELKSAILKLLT